MDNIRLKALKVDQPLGNFFITKIPASLLLDVAFSEELQYVDEDGKLKGNQRQKDTKRLKNIAKYIDSVEMSFPNSIILAANYNQNTGEIIDNKDLRWSVREYNNGIYEITIPTKNKLAAIIDGQHRLSAFEFVQNEERKNLELVCAIFFDISNAYQAFLFATINGNQKKVDKGLALEQFGFNVADEDSKSWTPEKFAVYYTRKLNFQPSALSGKIRLSPQYQEDMFKSFDNKKFYISTATVVDGILSLISSNPKRDRVEMGQKHILRGRSRDMLKSIRDNSPLRKLFLENSDEKIYNIIKEFFRGVEEELWTETYDNSYIIKTVGIQALFDLLKEILKRKEPYENINYKSFLRKFSSVDFSDDYFQASGVGKSRIKKVMFVANDFYSLDRVKKEDEEKIIQLLKI